MNIKQLLRTKQAKIAITSNAIYFGLMFYLNKTLTYTTSEIIYSLIFYLAFAIIISKAYEVRKATVKTYFVLGAISVFAYTIFMSLLFNGNLDLNWLNLLLASAQQGVLTGLIALLWGVSYD